MHAELESERKQLLDHWRKRLSRNPNWIVNQLPLVERVLLASRGDEHAQLALGSYLRQFHDKLGFKAKGSLVDGGLCAGAIFRTQAFIETRRRVGSRIGQSIHIEHTFPIRELRAEIVKRPFRDYVEALAWLLRHSVATAFHEGEKQYLLGRTSTSHALNPTSSEYSRPFVRYEKLHNAAGTVWNVFDREKIDPQKFTFQQHIEVVTRLLDEAGAAPMMISMIRTNV